MFLENLKRRIDYGKKSNFKIRGFLIILIFTLALIVPIISMPSASAAVKIGSDLKLKWTASVYGGGEDFLTYDALPQYPGEEVFHAAGPVQPSTTPGRVTCLNGVTGAQIWSVPIVGIGDTCQIQMADINKDGKMEIIVPLQVPGGLYILNATNGATIWRAPGTYTMNGSTYYGYIPDSPSRTRPCSGRIDSGPVIGDIDGGGYPTIFVGVMAYEEQPTTGKLVAYKWNATAGTIQERARAQVWHPCAGGLTLGDTDNDGVFELYMNERDQFFGDGAWGYGLASFWAVNLTRRWQVYDWGASSNKPMLIDVNKDGILDVVSTNLGSGICVLNSSDGRPLTGKNGVVLFDQNLGLPVHYQSSINDIDGDGNPELMCADGEHYLSYGRNWIPNDTEVWDLYNWNLEAKINTGICWKGPTIGNVTGQGDGLMDLIAITYDAGPYLNSTVDNSTVQIYHHMNDGRYRLMDMYDGMKYRCIYGVCQDVDNDGLNELMVLSQGGFIYCFDTQGKASTPRARSDVEYYSESRLGTSEYVPYIRQWPYIESPISPAPGAVGVSTSTSQLQFKLYHPTSGQLMSYTVTCTPNIIAGGVASGTSGNGVITIPVSGLTSSTTYHWQVNAIDQSGHKLSRDYYFSTGPYTPNSPPTQNNPLLNSSNGGNTIAENLSCYNQSTADANGNGVVNIYNWLRNGVPITNLNLPFDTKTSPNDEYSGFALARDYSGLGNYGNVFGATWVPNGVIGGAYSFNGNDFIRVNETNNNLGGSGTWNQMTLELWVQATSSDNNVKLVWKPDRYYPDNDVNSYELDLSCISHSQLQYTWIICSGATAYSITYTANVNPTSWHQIVCTYKSGSGLKIYVDGALGATSTAYTGNINGTSGPLEIAFNQGDGSDFTGLVDELRIYPTELTAQQILQNFNDAKNGLSSKSTIFNFQLTSGDNWSCQVTPNDGLADGTTRTSNTITVLPTSATVNLHVQVSGSGTTNATGDHSYNAGTSVKVSAMPSSGWVLSYWLLNGVNVGNVNPYALVMNANYNLTAVFSLISTQYTLHVEITGSGSTNATGDTSYNSGTSVTVLATANSGSVFSYWLLNGVNVGAANPYFLMMNSNYNLIAVFTSTGVLFSDGFESGNFNTWTGTAVTTGGSVSVVSNLVHQGTSSGQFSITTTTGTRRAYCYENVGSLSELYASAYIYIPSGLSLSSGQALWLIQFTDSGNAALASFGIRADATGLKWAVQSGNSPYAVGSAFVSGGGWYQVQAYFTHASSGKTLILTVNGVEVASLVQNTSASNNVALVRFGVVYYAGSAATSINVDDVAINSESTPTTQYSLVIGVQGSGSTNPVVGTYQYYAGSTATVTATAAAGWQFNGWLLDGANWGSTNPCSLTMNSNHNLIATFTQNPSSVLFADGFESGSFGAWTGTTVTTGGSVSVVSNLAHGGTRSGQFSITTTTGTRRAYCYENVGSVTTVNASAYVYIADGLPLASGQSLWLIQLVDSNGAVLSSFGIRADASGSKWAVQSGNSPYALAGSGVSLPSEGSWYLLEAYFTHAATGKTFVLTVNGVEVASLSQNTSASNNVASVRFGAGYYSGSSTASIYVDDVTVK